MGYVGEEKRKYPRINGRFIVSYRILENGDNVDVSQTKNVSVGGMLLTTNRQFDSDTKLALEIRLPFDPNPITVVGKVLESREIIKDLIYDTRIEFLRVDDVHRNIISQTIDYYQKKDRGEVG